MFAADCSGFDVGAGTEDRGDTVIEGEEVTGIVPFDPEGVVVQPGIITNKTSTRETQMVLMNNVEVDMLMHLMLLVDSFRPV